MSENHFYFNLGTGSSFPLPINYTFEDEDEDDESDSGDDIPQFYSTSEKRKRPYPSELLKFSSNHKSLFKMSKSDLFTLTNDELKNICSYLDLKVGGNKDELVNRISDEIKKTKKANVPNHLSKSDLFNMTNENLKELCSILDLKVGGNKDELVNRIYDEFTKRGNKKKEKKRKEQTL